MVELHEDSLIFSFPDKIPEAKLTITFKKNLRLPDDGNDYHVPEYSTFIGFNSSERLDRFPLEHIDDYSKNIPSAWTSRGGVMLPMYQSEAMRISFHSECLEQREQAYFFAVKIAAGKINVLNGNQWVNELSGKPQDYLVVPGQSSLDGYFVKPGFVRQFVAMPLGKGYSAEGQLTGKEDVGGLQIIVYPLKWEVFDKVWPVIPPEIKLKDEAGGYSPSADDIRFCRSTPMVLAPGGLIPFELNADEFQFPQWDHETYSRCFVHLVNSEDWQAITDKHPPSKPITTEDYEERDLPWLDQYQDIEPQPDSGVRGRLKSIFQMKRKHKRVRLLSD